MAKETARTQDKRHIGIETPVGKDKLLLMAMHGTEALGRMYQFELDLVAEGEAIPYTKILGQNVAVRLNKYAQPGSDEKKEAGEPRYFNGIISRFTLVGVDENQEHKRIFTYRATMVPHVWLLTRKANCRMFQEKTVVEIVQQILEESGYTDINADGLLKKYRTWEYCVQYRETDFNFISRLLENEGIYYYFKHEQSKHTMVLCDDPTAHKVAENYDELHFDEPDHGSTHDAFIWNWVLGHEIEPNRNTTRDFNPLQPEPMETPMDVELKAEPSLLEIYDYPGGYTTDKEGREYADVRVKEASATYGVGRGVSCARGIYAGCTFTLVDHPVCNTADDEYLITSISYELRSDDMGGGLGKTSSEEGYSCQVTCMPKPFKFHPARTTPKPIVQGPQTAIVAGPTGEEIYTDKYGRVKVQFHWDREGKCDEKASCWIRVSQNWAGKQWGIIFNPRIGQEVVVEFLEGDPDRPLITGRVYNGTNMPPYELPKNQTMSTIKSNSSKDAKGFNEFRFEDKAGEEQIFMHAQKNMDLRVVNDRFETVGHNMHVTVDNDSLLRIKNKYHVQVDADYHESVNKDHHEKIGGNENQDIGKSRSLTIGANLSEDITGNHSEHVGGKYSLKVDGDLVIESDSSITIKVGGTSIAIGSDGIKIATDGNFTTESAGQTSMKADGPFSIESSAKLDAKAGAAASFAGAKVAIKADGLLDLQAGGILKAQGSMIKLN